MTFVILQSHSFPQWRARLGFMSRPEKCRNGEKCWMWSELGRERGDVGKVEMKRVDLPGAVHLTTTAPSPSAPPLIILISSFWQFLTVLAETKKLWRGCLKIHTRKVDIDLGGDGWGRPFFALARWGWELCLNSHKKRCNYLRPSDDLSALGARPRAASWLDTRSGKILKKCEWRGRALVTREREPESAAPAQGEENWLEERGWWW